MHKVGTQYAKVCKLPGAPPFAIPLRRREFAGKMGNFECLRVGVLDFDLESAVQAI